jgi:thiol-disulfide isomerase/thioredoxin
MKRWWFRLALAAIALFAAFAGYRLSTPRGASETTLAAMPTPATFELVLRDLKGQPQNLGQWRGKVLVVNYWATWCEPCRQEMPGFSRLQEKYREKGVQFVGISIDEAAKIVEFQSEIPVTYPLLIGDMDSMKGSADLGNNRQGLPFTAVFDRQGSLAATKLGRFAEADLERELVELIAP